MHNLGRMHDCVCKSLVLNFEWKGMEERMQSQTHLHDVTTISSGSSALQLIILQAIFNSIVFAFFDPWQLAVSRGRKQCCELRISNAIVNQVIKHEILEGRQSIVLSVHPRN